jgi:hypothetical protein
LPWALTCSATENTVTPRKKDTRLTAQQVSQVLSRHKRFQARLSRPPGNRWFRAAARSESPG